MVYFYPVIKPTDRRPRLNIVQTPKLMNLKPFKKVPPSLRETVCSICGILLKSKVSLDRHLASKHNIGAKYNCEVCVMGNCALRSLSLQGTKKQVILLSGTSIICGEQVNPRATCPRDKCHEITYIDSISCHYQILHWH